MILAGELLGAFVGGLLALPVSGVVWWRWLGGRRKAMQKLLGPLAGAMAAAPTVKASTPPSSFTAPVSTKELPGTSQVSHRCLSCRRTVLIPNATAWPERCPWCHAAPFASTSGSAA